MKHQNIEKIERIVKERRVKKKNHRKINTLSVILSSSSSSLWSLTGRWRRSEDMLLFKKLGPNYDLNKWLPKNKINKTPIEKHGWRKWKQNNQSLTSKCLTFCFPFIPPFSIRLWLHLWRNKIIYIFDWFSLFWFNKMKLNRCQLVTNWPSDNFPFNYN